MTIAVSFCQYNMLYAERHRTRSVGLAGAVHRTWAVAEKNDWQFSNPRIDGSISWIFCNFRIFLSTGTMVHLITIVLMVWRKLNFFLVGASQHKLAPRWQKNPIAY